MYKQIKTVLIVLFTCAGVLAFAQGGNGQPPANFRKAPNANRMRKPTVAKRFEELKKAYISQRLALTPEQSAKFWPTYDEYQDELEYVANLRKANNATADPNGDQFDRELGFQARITNLQKHYYEEFIKVMPPEKANMVFKSERDFKFELLRRLKEGKDPM